MNHDIEMDWLKKWSLYTPDSIAIHDILHNRKYNYGEFYKAAQGLIPYLESLGVKKGDRVAIFSENRVEILFLFFALQRIGAILVPINFRFTASETDFVIKDSGANLIFFENVFNPVMDNLLQNIQKISMDELNKYVESALLFDGSFAFAADFEKACMILYTSGTTGFPKGVVITPKMLFWNSVNTQMSLNLSNQDKMISFLPLFHTGGWNVLLTPFIHHGAQTLFLPRFDAELILNLCEKEKVSILFGVPTTLNLMTQVKDFDLINLKSLRFAVVGGEPMSLYNIKLWHKKGVSIRQGFGLTECGPNCFSLSAEDAEKKIGSIGRPNFYVQTLIVDESNKEVKCNQVGELLLKGPMCMTEYWQNVKATESSFYHGWLRTGDLVKKDENNYFYVVGRKKEMFISGGENVYPAEIEKVLSLHPHILEVAVLGVKDIKWGEVGKAFIVKKENSQIQANEIFEFCQNQLARYKVPKQIEFLNELPKGSTGKILKNKLIDFKGPSPQGGI